MMNFLWQILYLPCPTKPGVLRPPPMVPARVVNFIPQGVIPGVIAVYGHDSIAHRQHRGDTFAATAGGHRVMHHAIEVIVVDLAAGSFENEIIYAFPLPQFGVDGFALWQRAGWGRWD